MKLKVIAVEKQQDRYEEALRLKFQWYTLGCNWVEGVQFVNADIRNRMDLLRGIDTLVAVRCIYYLREDIPKFFNEVAKRVPRVVLCGNPHRWPKYKHVPEKLGEFNYYSSLEGMKDILRGSGYRIIHEVKDGDPIVTGAR